MCSLYNWHVYWDVLTGMLDTTDAMASELKGKVIRVPKIKQLTWLVGTILTQVTNQGGNTLWPGTERQNVCGFTISNPCPQSVAMDAGGC